MVHTVVRWHVRDIERVYTFETAHVVAIFVRIRAALVMRIDAAIGAEIVFRRFGVELIQLQHIMPFDDFDAR